MQTMPAFVVDESLPARSIPANIEAERAVLGSCLIDPDAFAKVSALLTSADFFRERHGWLFEAMTRLQGRREPLDFVTLVDELECQKVGGTNRLEQIGGPAFLTDLIADTPTALYAEHYAGIVEETAVRRRMIGAAGKLAEAAYDEGADLDESMNKGEKAVFDVRAGRKIANRDLAWIRSIMPGVVDRIDFLSRNPQALGGIPTGFTDVDRILGGLQKSDLIILAARPGFGKTSFALNMGVNAAKKYGFRVAVFSLEMSKEQLSQRLLSAETGIDSHRLRLGTVHEEEWPILLEAANVLASTNLFIDDTPSVGANDIRAKAMRLYVEGGLDLIIVDYLQLMQGASGKGQNRNLEISEITRSLKILARELNIPILCLSQLSRAVESRADKRPMLSDLRDSGAVEQDADVVLFIYREDMYVEDTDRQNIADILIAKHRHGATGTVSLYFRKELTQFRDLEIQRTELAY